MGDYPNFETAINNADSRMVRQLAESGSNIPGSILHTAAKSGEATFIDELLLDNHVNTLDLDVNVKDDFGRTPLFLAASNSQVPAIKVLLQHGAKVDQVDQRGRNALHYAADSMCQEACEIILEKAVQSDICTATLLNQKELYIGAEQCFLVRGKDKGQYAWHYVVVDRGFLNTFAQVINKGQVDVGHYGTIIASGWGFNPPQDVIDNTTKRFDPAFIREENLKADMTPLHYAIVRKQPDLARKMLEYGADPNLTDSFGLNAVHLAAMRGQLTLLTQLELKGADMKAKDLKNRIPLHIAGANKHENVENFLRSPLCLAPTKGFVDKALKDASELLEPQILAAKTVQGEDVRGYVVRQLRELESRIHDVLYEVGTTPVMQATSPPEDVTHPEHPGSRLQLAGQ